MFDIKIAYIAGVTNPIKLVHMRSGSLDTSYLNPFHISEDVVADLHQGSTLKSMPFDHKTVMSRTERLQLLIG